MPLVVRTEAYHFTSWRAKNRHCMFFFWFARALHMCAALLRKLINFWAWLKLATMVGRAKGVMQQLIVMQTRHGLLHQLCLQLRARALGRPGYQRNPSSLV